MPKVIPQDEPMFLSIRGMLRSLKKQIKARQWLTQLWQQESGRISAQVMNG